MVSLWIVPTSEDAEKLEPLMRPTRTLSKESSYPKFHPHVTLASIPERDLAEIRASLPQALPPLPIRFASLDVGTYYFRSVYISIQLTPELQALHSFFHEHIKVAPKTPSFPHFSLCYISDEDATKGERQIFADELENSGTVRKEDDGSVSLRCSAPEGGESWMNGYQAGEIWVVRCEGPVEQWQVVDKILLTK